MAKVPFFTVIIPTYNRAKLLKVAINSVLEQSFKDFELIIVDDGSTDETQQVVHSFVDQRIIYHFQENQERSVARNVGVDFAKGEYICFLDDDDYYLPNHLGIFYDELSKANFPKIILRTGFIQLENGHEIDRSIPFSEKNGLTPTCFCAENFCAVVTLCIPKSFLKEHKFPKEFRHWQDTHLILRLLALYPFKQLDAFTYIYVQHSNMGSRSIYQLPDANERIQSNVDAMFHLFKYHGKLINPFLRKYSMNHMVSQKYLHHANGALVNGRIKMAIFLFLKSVRANKRFWFLQLYLRFLIKVPTKLLFNLPKAP